MAKSPAKPSYESLLSELEGLLAELQREDLDIDRALQQYQRGLELVKELDTYLRTAENTVKEIKAKFSAA